MPPPLFPGRTGTGIRVAVIDSGVHPGHAHIDAARIAPGVAILPDGSVEDSEDATRDRLGHGTAVTAAIQEKAPGATFLPVRVFRDGLRTSAAALVAAIRWSVEARADLINLSLGTTNAAHRPFFAAAIEEALDGGSLVIAAREANGAPCYPGVLQGVASVELDWDCPRARLDVSGSGSQPLFRAAGYPRGIPGVPERRNLYGISFAVAQTTGFAALAAEALGREKDGRDRAEAVRHALAAACRERSVQS